MKQKHCVIAFASLLFAIQVTAGASPLVAQTGSVEFSAHVAPSGGLDEPVRGFPVYLLSKSFTDIEKEVRAEYPKPDMDAFIDKLDVSSELKAWMKENHWTQLAGEDFTHKIQVDDIMNVPEFYKAYLDRNAGDQSADFPTTKLKQSEKDPAKIAKLTKDYNDAIRRYIPNHPASIDGIDLGLQSVDPSQKWNALIAKQEPDIHRELMELSQSKYFVARTVTDIQGAGSFQRVAPGNYWVSTLDVNAIVGDARPRWDVPVTVKAGGAARLDLSNFNAAHVTHAPTP